MILDIDKLNEFRNSTIESNRMESSRKFTALNQKQADKTQKSDQFNFREEFINTIFKNTSFDSKKLVQIGQIITDMNDNIDPDKLPQDLNYEYINFLIEEISKKISKNQEISQSDSDSYHDEKLDDNFRLPILKSNKKILKSKDDYIDDFIKDKVRDINAVKTLDIDGHKKINEIKRVQKIVPKDWMTNDQRFFQKIYGNMGVGSLRAVDKAYEERNINDRRLNLQRMCEEAKNYEKLSRKQIEHNREERKKVVMENSRQDILKLDESRKTEEKKLAELQKQVKFKRENLINFKKNRRRDLQLAIEFSKQHISVSKALQKHEFILKKENILSQKSNFVLDYKTEVENQADLVRKFIHQRCNMKQLQSINEKTIIEDKIKNQKECQLEKAKNRVKLLRSVEPLKLRPIGVYRYKFGSHILDNTENRPNTIVSRFSLRNDAAFMERLNTDDEPLKIVN